MGFCLFTAGGKRSRRGNGPSPHISGFMDFWVERGVDILDLGEVDREVE